MLWMRIGAALVTLAVILTLGGLLHRERPEANQIAFWGCLFLIAEGLSIVWIVAAAS